MQRSQWVFVLCSISCWHTYSEITTRGLTCILSSYAVTELILVFKKSVKLCHRTVVASLSKFSLYNLTLPTREFVQWPPVQLLGWGVKLIDSWIDSLQLYCHYKPIMCGLQHINDVKVCMNKRDMAPVSTAWSSLLFLFHLFVKYKCKMLVSL